MDSHIFLRTIHFPDASVEFKFVSVKILAHSAAELYYEFVSGFAYYGSSVVTSVWNVQFTLPSILHEFCVLHNKTLVRNSPPTCRIGFRRGVVCQTSLYS